MKRVLAAATVLLAYLATPAFAEDSREVVVILIDGSSLPELLAVPELRDLASTGGAQG